MVALAAAVESLLADVLLFQFAFSDRQHGRSCVPTQHWKIFVSEIVWFVLQDREKEKDPQCYL